jgi:hypothetical protein
MPVYHTIAYYQKQNPRSMKSVLLLQVVFCYRNVKFVRIQEDEEDEVQYVHMEDPSAAEITFVRAPCPSKEVLYVGCSDLGISFYLHIFFC